jgi:hypothetical protein
VNLKIERNLKNNSTNESNFWEQRFANVAERPVEIVRAVTVRRGLRTLSLAPVAPLGEPSSKVAINLKFPL